jgi:hypothetical protein
MIHAPHIIFVPIPVPVPEASRRGLDRDPDWNPPREPKTTPRWPLQQSIPSPETRRLLDTARRELAEQRATRLMRELVEQRP